MSSLFWNSEDFTHDLKPWIQVRTERKWKKSILQEYTPDRMIFVPSSSSPFSVIFIPSSVLLFCVKTQAAFNHKTLYCFAWHFSSSNSSCHAIITRIFFLIKNWLHVPRRVLISRELFLINKVGHKWRRKSVEGEREEQMTRQNKESLQRRRFVWIWFPWFPRSFLSFLDSWSLSLLSRYLGENDRLHYLSCLASVVTSPPTEYLPSSSLKRVGR